MGITDLASTKGTSLANMDFMRGWNLVASTFLKQGRSSESISGEGKSNVVEANKISKKDEIEEVVWTENDTGDIMDLMETALNNVKKKLLTKLKRNNAQVEQEDVVKKEEMEVERLEDFISSVQTNTLNVVEEINSVMQIIAEVTTDNADSDMQGTEGIPDINPAETTVGQILGNDQDSEAKENWQRLMSKLSTKRKKSMKRKSKRSQMITEDLENPVCMNPQVSSYYNDVDTNDKDDEDSIPDDWKPDFIPPRNNSKQNYKNNQPDVIPVDVDERCQSEDDEETAPPPYPEVRKRINTMPQTRRSENRRYLRRQIVELHRQSWAGDLLVVQEEEDNQEKKERKVRGKGIGFRNDRRNSSLQDLYM